MPKYLSVATIIKMKQVWLYYFFLGFGFWSFSTVLDIVIFHKVSYDSLLYICICNVSLKFYVELVIVDYQIASLYIYFFCVKHEFLICIL